MPVPTTTLMRDKPIWWCRRRSRRRPRDAIKEIFESKVVESGANGAREESHSRLTSLLYRYQDLFRVGFAADPPSVKVPPLKVQIKGRIEPVIAISRRYPLLHHDFLLEHIPSLEEHNLVHLIPDPRWGSAARIVAKKTSEAIGWRWPLHWRDQCKTWLPLASLDEPRCYFAGLFSFLLSTTSTWKQPWLFYCGNTTKALYNLLCNCSTQVYVQVTCCTWLRFPHRS